VEKEVKKKEKKAKGVSYEPIMVLKTNEIDEMPFLLPEE